MQQHGKLRIVIAEAEKSLTYTLEGKLDEHFHPEALPLPAPGQDSVVELGGVRALNSCGLREWIRFVKKLGSMGRVTLERCSLAVMEEVNRLPASLGRSRISSFYAPYYCPCCGETSELIETMVYETVLARDEAPSLPCRSCGACLEFDGLPASYFLFMSYGEERLPAAS